MPNIEELLRRIQGDRLRQLVTAGLEREVLTVALAESLADVDEAPAGALVLLTRVASAQSSTYRFDVAIRRGAERGIAGLVLTDPYGEALSSSARAVADRARVGLLAADEEVDLAELASSLGGLLRGDAAAALEAATSGLRALDRARGKGLGVSGTVAVAGQVLPGAALGEPAAGLRAEPVEVDGVREAWFVAPEGDAVDALLLRAAAADVAAAMGRIRREEDAPVRSRSELLTELLATEPGRDGGLLRRARALGLAVDAWHTVTFLGFAEGEAPESADPIHAEELRRALERVSLSTARAVSGTWHVARSEGAVVLLRTSDTEPGPQEAPALTAAAAVLVALEERFAGIRPRAGVGRVHLGPGGLRASAGEARAALAAAHPGEPPGVFDASGLHGMLAEWYATDSARRSVSSLLEPLEQLGGRRADEAIRTLQIFLDEQGSVTRAARRLHLHRNAVAYRIGRIKETLEVDPNDPEARLALQLACRARLLV
ncbi:MAG: helix-turn-helix domain-containing protein [Actinomycetota bacterium]